MWNRIQNLLQPPKHPGNSKPPFSVNDDEVHRLYTACQSLEKLQSKNVTSRNPMFIEAGLDAVTEHIWLIK